MAKSKVTRNRSPKRRSEKPVSEGIKRAAEREAEYWQLLAQSVSPYSITPCDNCADLTAAMSRVLRGGGFGYDASPLLSSYRSYDAPSYRGDGYGFGARCARSAP
jgi:formylglycine-generating enzyme required for sulfatase activity